VVDFIVGNAQIAFQGEVGFRKEQNVSVATAEKGLQLESMLYQAVGIP
jgi:hypothetical protein